MKKKDENAVRLGRKGGNKVKRSLGKEWFRALINYRHGNISLKELEALKKKLYVRKG